MEKTGVIVETKWSIDSTHSEIGFKVRHLMISNVKGSFRKFDASIYTTEKDFTTATVDLWIDASSITTGDEKRDEHLKSEDFLDVQKYKQITFSSSTIGKPDHEGNQELWGELTIKEITKNIKLNVQFGGTATDPWGNEKAGFTVSGKINRSEWELVWNKTLDAGGIMIGDEISISCELELVNHVKATVNMQIEG
jgi:polyisoprenoid-binding protein YceI